MTVAFWVVSGLDSDVYAGRGLLVRISDVVERVIAKVNVVVTCTALILAALASVARIVLGTRVGYFHNNASAIASAVPAAVVLAANLKSAATHSGWARRALALANVLVPAVIAHSFGTSGV